MLGRQTATSADHHEDGELFIGLPCPDVSRRHLLLEYRDGAMHVSSTQCEE